MAFRVGRGVWGEPEIYWFPGLEEYHSLAERVERILLTVGGHHFRLFQRHFTFHTPGGNIIEWRVNAFQQ
jgi:hypothetical protein